MTVAASVNFLPDEEARRRALLNHGSTLLVEAGAGSGKTALLAGRIALLLASGIPARQIVAITFTESASSELLARIKRFVDELAGRRVPDELRLGLPNGISAEQTECVSQAAAELDQLTCATIHGFCQQLIRPYPVEAGIDPGAVVIDPPAAELAYQDLTQAWLAARFGRDRGSQGLGRLPALPSGGEEGFFAELLADDPDSVVKLIQEAATFLRSKRTATAPPGALDRGVLLTLEQAIAGFAEWYTNCGVVESSTDEILAELQRIRQLAQVALTAPSSGRQLAALVRHDAPMCQHGTEARFSAWRRKSKWEKASVDAGGNKARGGQLSTEGESHYARCDAAYQAFVSGVCDVAFARFVEEFRGLSDLYKEYKRQAALLDFDDLLYHARDLLAGNDLIRQELGRRYTHVLVDEFQDTDPIQAEILWRLCGDGEPDATWSGRVIRPGNLFVVGDPKQAIYRFRGADVETYLEAKRSLLAQNPGAVIEITSNFRSLKPILDFANSRFQVLLSVDRGQPGFTALEATRAPDNGQPAVTCFDIAIQVWHKKGNRLAVDLVRREEAGIVADLLQRLIGTYQIRDKATKAMRPCRAGDVALLAPTGTSLWIYERELENRGISIASQAGKSFFRRQEVQDLVAISRAISDRHDTLGLGALLRGPLVGLSEEEIADAIVNLPPSESGRPGQLHLWTEGSAVRHPILKNVLGVLQGLAKKARQTTPYQLMAEAVDDLNVRPMLRVRYGRGAERALANVELFLEMARAYDVRGLKAFVEALRASWEDAEKQIEGRPDADADAVSIITMHSAKGLEWPIVIPVNSPTELVEKASFLHRRRDDTVHFKLLGRAGGHYEQVKNEEREHVRRERIRLWYVALTRACDLLLLPRQSERANNDWLSLLDLTLDDVGAFDGSAYPQMSTVAIDEVENSQDEATWAAELETIAAARRTITWLSPSRHEGRVNEEPPGLEEVFSVTASPSDGLLAESDPTVATSNVVGGRIRGTVLHKLLEELLTGETTEDINALELRAKTLLDDLGAEEADSPERGLSAYELAATTLRALAIPRVAELRPRMVPEISVYSAEEAGNRVTYVGGIVDAIVLDHSGAPRVVVDWKSDPNPEGAQIELYRAQIRDYLSATGAQEGLLVFVSTGKVEQVHHA